MTQLAPKPNRLATDLVLPPSIADQDRPAHSPKKIKFASEPNFCCKIKHLRDSKPNPNRPTNQGANHMRTRGRTGGRSLAEPDPNQIGFAFSTGPKARMN